MGKIELRYAKKGKSIFPDSHYGICRVITNQMVVKYLDAQHKNVEKSNKVVAVDHSLCSAKGT